MDGKAPQRSTGEKRHASVQGSRTEVRGLEDESVKRVRCLVHVVLRQKCRERLLDLFQVVRHVDTVGWVERHQKDGQLGVVFFWGGGCGQSTGQTRSEACVANIRNPHPP